MQRNGRDAGWERARNLCNGGGGGGWGRGRYTRRISMGELACVAKNQHEKCDCNGAVGGGGGGA